MISAAKVPIASTNGAPFELLESQPLVAVPDSEYKRLLGFPTGYVFQGRVAELVEETRAWFSEYGRPWIYGHETEIGRTTGAVRIGEAAFTSKRLEQQIMDAEAGSAVIVTVSAGQECEERARQLWLEGKPDEYFFTEVYGSAVVEHLVTTAGARICSWAEENGMLVLPHYSPGYSGWDIAEQPKFFELIRTGSRSPFPGPIRVLESGMLQPKKSLLAVFALTRRLDKGHTLAKLPCENCSYHPCQYRRAAYQNGMAQIEDVRLLQTRSEPAVEPSMAVAALDQNGRYSVNARALRKWSSERLHLRILEDRSVEAIFRYEGTTCSNLGRPLEYHYVVKLSAPEDKYRIIEASCSPAAGDTGHTQQCEYINNRGNLLSAIEREKPLHGSPLNEVLHWQRPYHPAACYCDADGRNHKWGLVLEVIHYSLVQREKVSKPVSN